MQILNSLARSTMVAALAAAMVAGCGTTETLLEVQDPDIINPSDVTTAAAANALRLGALARLNGATTGGESTVLLGGLLADEYRSSDTFLQRNEVDRRAIDPSNANTTAAFRSLYRARLSAQQAIDGLTEFAAPGWQVAQMYFVQAYVENQLAEDFCGHIPFSTVVDGREQLGTALTTQAAFELALSHADSALAAATGTTADAVTMRNAAAVLKGRILLNLNRHAEAATAVTGVPTTFRYFLEHSANTGTNATWSLNNNIGRWYVSQGEGTNGLDFTADQSRVPTCRVAGTSSTVNGTKVGCASDTPVLKPFDPNTPVIAGTIMIVQQKWQARYDSMSIATGVEARLIEAEAALKGGNTAGALTILNTLRATKNLAPLTDAGSTAANVTQLFNERAYWLFGTGHRLGDLRRLVRQYSRTAESVFPTGAWWKGGNYGTDVNIPVPQAEENNPNFARASCVASQA